jgi:tetrapyrrole methylase family protein/MazG family protein
VGAQLSKLVKLVAHLRSPKGCPWDREQTHVSLIPYLKEEALEVEHALKAGRWEDIEDELGDLMLQVLLHAQIASERGDFDLEDVAKAQYLKLKRRHPHVFGARAKFKSGAEVKLNWKEIKKTERRLRAKDLAVRVKKRR